ncbi:hypothetical protein J6590_051789 [Homalodisca vitripennis]|nr:hypothetical protein J6590_051789 [Homalodisca vitripennis]
MVMPTTVFLTPLSKVFEGRVLVFVVPAFNQIFTNRQYGFWSGTTNLLSLQNYVISSSEREGEQDVVHFDYAKFFYKISHTHLLEKS